MLRGNRLFLNWAKAPPIEPQARAKQTRRRENQRTERKTTWACARLCMSSRVCLLCYAFTSDLIARKVLLMPVVPKTLLFGTCSLVLGVFGWLHVWPYC
eukprot:6193454-Pleurochrysis_carterae.AAC.1